MAQQRKGANALKGRAQRNAGTPEGTGHADPGHPVWLHRLVVGVVSAVMLVEAVLLIVQGQWLSVFVLLLIIIATLSPTRVGRMFRVYIPLDFQVIATLFVFAALYLGETRDFYERQWWWDLALHFTSGVLLGILGFLMAYVLNEDDRIDLRLRPAFMAIFAFLFAFSIGALWDLFEFAMDTIFGMNMQKPRLGDPSGLTDTMLDLVADALGAFVVSVYGWWFMSSRSVSFIERMVVRFIRHNPQLFKLKRTPDSFDSDE